MNRRTDIRNIAIIAHVDHGKTTLVDKILASTGHFKDRDKPVDQFMDQNDLEKERGITIVSKNITATYKGVRINIIDTPGHADFGGEVERVLNMADGVLLLVDAFEGPMPQTRYVLSKALSLDKKVVVVINKVDKDNCRPDEVQEMVFDLMCELDAGDDQLDFPTIYGSAKNGWMGPDYNQQTDNVDFLLDQILEHIPGPLVDEGDLQLQITAIDHSNYIGRIAIGKVKRGTIKPNQQISLIKRDGSISKLRIRELFGFEGQERVPREEIKAGDICAISGIEKFEIGDTVSDPENPEAMPPIAVDEPTMSMLFTVNDSPFFGREGKFVTSRQLRDRLLKETEKNLALRVEETTSPEVFNVHGRGVLHLSILLETMRRESYEVQVGKPRVLVRQGPGGKEEPIESLVIECPDDYSGTVIDMVTKRMGELEKMEPRGGMMHLEFNIPTRGLIGLKNLMLTATAGEAIMYHRFSHYAPWKGEIESRNKGVMIASEPGVSIPFAMNKLQDRGIFFIPPGVEIYQGQIVGEHSRENDLVVNLTKAKKLTNVRAAGSDDKVKLPPPRLLSLEQAMEYIGDDEYVEITPGHIRLRKILLSESDRKRKANPALAHIKF
ncbi:MAG: translational GTPase TypA [Saprospirales bacterium]|nr:MAG: translational GTPase TypA [Saprospirales bacterium]